MSLESQINHLTQKGSIEVICGSMFSGKTEELLRRLKRAQFAKLDIAVFKPKIDNRYDTQKVVSHDDNTITCSSVFQSIIPSFCIQMSTYISNIILIYFQAISNNLFSDLYG